MHLLIEPLFETSGSKECQLRPGEPLNAPGPVPEGVTASEERAVIETLLAQKQAEADYVELHKNDNG